MAKRVSEIIRPNTTDDAGEYWSPWESLGLTCCSYNGDIDRNAIDVLHGIAAGLSSTEIAVTAGISPEHVELLQGIFCSADWCEYGTSPRGCWPMDREGFPALIKAWMAYFDRQWSEVAPASVVTSEPPV